MWTTIFFGLAVLWTVVIFLGGVGLGVKLERERWMSVEL